MKIRPMIRNDLKQIAEIDSLSYPPSLITSVENMIHFFDSRKNTEHLDVLQLPNDEIIGFVGYSMNSPCTGCSNIWNLAIHPNYRNRGYGASLLQHVIELARSQKMTWLELSVSETHLNAYNLYLRCGFAVYKQILRYYPDKTNAIVMRLDLQVEGFKDEPKRTSI